MVGIRLETNSKENMVPELNDFVEKFSTFNTNRDNYYETIRQRRKGTNKSRKAARRRQMKCDTVL